MGKSKYLFFINRLKYLKKQNKKSRGWLGIAIVCKGTGVLAFVNFLVIYGTLWKFHWKCSHFFLLVAIYMFLSKSFFLRESYKKNTCKLYITISFIHSFKFIRSFIQYLQYLLNIYSSFHSNYGTWNVYYVTTIMINVYIIQQTWHTKIYM